MQKNNTKDAEENYKKALRLKPTSKEGKFYLGLFQMEQKDYKAALMNFYELLQIADKETKLYQISKSYYDDLSKIKQF